MLALIIAASIYVCISELLFLITLIKILHYKFGKKQKAKPILWLDYNKQMCFMYFTCLWLIVAVIKFVVDAFKYDYE